jgi:hypothetical protein
MIKVIPNFVFLNNIIMIGGAKMYNCKEADKNHVGRLHYRNEKKFAF